MEWLLITIWFTVSGPVSTATHMKDAKTCNKQLALFMDLPLNNTREGYCVKVIKA